MLGEGARTAADADKYFDAYAAAIEAIGASAGNATPAGAVPEFRSSFRRCIRASKRFRASGCWPNLCRAFSRSRAWPRRTTCNSPIDAEEADRLELSLEVIGAVLGDPSLRGWDGFGLAVQAYQKRALAVIGWIEDAAATMRRPADRAPGQGRLLGHRDQARAGARAGRLSGVHPQGHDRSLLHGLRQEAPRRARSHVSAIRHP